MADGTGAGAGGAGERPSVPWALVLLGTLAGAALGAAAFWALLEAGLFGVAVPGACVGIGAGLPLRRRSLAVGAVAGAVAFALSLVCAWSLSAGSISLAEFLAVLGNASTRTHLQLAAGTLFGFWFGIGRDRGARHPPPAAPSGPPN